MKNWTEARAVRATDQRFAKIDRLLVEIGGIWADENEYLVTQADDLRRTITEARAEVKEQVQSLREERAQRAADEAQL